MEIVLRQADSKQTARIATFLKKNPSKHVLTRPKEIEKAAGEGLYFVLEAEGSICGAAGVFDLNPGAVEMGGARIVPPAQGFGLQRLLQAMRIAKATLNHAGAYAIITAIDPSNDKSNKTTMRSGFQIWKSPDEDVYDACSGCAKKQEGLLGSRRCCCDFYELPLEARANAIQTVLDFPQEGKELVHRIDGRKITLRLEARMLQEEAGRGDLAEFVAASRVAKK